MIVPASKTSAIPACIHFGTCAGCQLQDIPYLDQLASKAERVRMLLSGLQTELPEIELHPSPPYGYRNKVRFTFTRDVGQLRVGLLRRGQAENTISPDDEQTPAPSDLFETLAIRECPIAAPLLWRATEALLDLGRSDRACAMWLENADQIELFSTGDETSLQMTLFVRPPGIGGKSEEAIRLLFSASPPSHLAHAFAKFCDKVKGRLPELAGAGVTLLPPASKARSRRGENARTALAWGAPGVLYAVDALAFWVPRGAFFQVNRFLIPALSRLVTHAGDTPRTGALAWDLYAGVGLFSRRLALAFDSVVAVEVSDASAMALAATKMPNLKAVRATTLNFLQQAVLQRDRPDLIVLDPPRSGAGPEVCAYLARIAAPEVIYVSCSPETLAADLAALLVAGYFISKLHLIDLFPQTVHTETVVYLRRSA